MTIKKCEQCKKEFRKWGNPRLGSAYRFCGKQCYWDSMKMKKPNICETCGKEFITKSHVLKTKRCSRECMFKNEDFLKKQREKQLGIEAWNKGKPNTWSNGEKSNFWIDGRTPENKKIRSSLEYRIWREAVFARDNWTCVNCNQHGGDLHADHIKPFALFPELRFAIDNGRTLCVDCHRQTDTYGSQKMYRNGGLD